MRHRVGGEWPLAVCARCGLQWMHPQPDDAVLAAIYGKDYFNAWGLAAGEEPAYLRKMKKATFRRQLRLLASHLPQGRVLDVGCATGLFMEAAQEQGYAVNGLDISAFAVQIARAKFGDDAVHLGQLDTLPGRGLEYDAIPMRD